MAPVRASPRPPKRKRPQLRKGPAAFAGSFVKGEQPWRLTDQGIRYWSSRCFGGGEKNRLRNVFVNAIQPPTDRKGSRWNAGDYWAVELLKEIQILGRVSGKKENLAGKLVEDAVIERISKATQKEIEASEFCMHMILEDVRAAIEVARGMGIEPVPGDENGKYIRPQKPKAKKSEAKLEKNAVEKNGKR